MTDNVENAYLQRLSAQQKADNNAAADAFLAEFAGSPVTAAPQPATPKPQPVPEQAPSPGFWKETGKAVFGGATDALTNMWNTIDDAATWMDNNVMDLRMGSSTFGAWGGRKATLSGIIAPHQADLQVSPLVAPSETTGGQVARSITQFVVPFAGVMKGLSLGARAAKLRSAGAMAAGAVADFSAFDPHEKRLSNLVNGLTEQHPGLKNPITEYLAADPNDTAMEGRFKNALEGMGLGLGVDMVFRGVKTLRDISRAKKEAGIKSKLDAADAADQAAPKAPTEDLTAHAVDTSKAPEMDLAKQIELVTGLDRAERPGQRSQRYLDMKAALSDAEKAKQAVDGAAVKASDSSIPLAEPWQKAEADIASGKTHSLLWDAESETIAFTKDAPSPTQLPLDQRVLPVLAKAPHMLTAEDKIVLRGYRQLQEAAFSEIRQGAKKTDEAPPHLIVEESVGAGPRKATSEAPAASSYKEGDTVWYGNGEGSGQVLKLARGGKVAIKDDATGAVKVVTPDPEDELLGSIKANNEALYRAAGREQGGFASPTLLAHLAGSGIGAAIGWNQAEDDASLADKLTLAGLGAVAGSIGAKALRVGKHKVLSPAEARAVETLDPLVKDLARPEVASVAPRVETMTVTKLKPRIPSGKVDEIVTALKDGDMAQVAAKVKESDFNFDHIDTEDGVKELIDGFSAVFAKETDRAKHGIQSFEQMKELAGEVGAGLESLTKLYQGTDNLGARILAHRSLLAASAEKVRDLSKLAMEGDMTSMLALRKQVALHASIQSQIKGVQTEVARALASYRIMSSSVGMAVDERNMLIDKLGGLEANQKFAQQLSEITDPKALHRVLEKSAYAKTADALFEAWRAGLLSGPATHAANFTGNLLTALFSPAERLAASAVGTILRNPEAIHAAEVKAQVYGMVRGAIDALRIGADGFRTLKNAGGEILRGDYHASLKTIREGEETLPEAVRALFNDDAGPSGLYGGLTGDVLEHTPAISSANFKLDPGSVWGRGVDLMGAAIRLPYRALASADALFQVIHFSGELHAQAYRSARKEGLVGDGLAQRIAQLAEDPTPEMLAAARKTAVQNTFQEPLGPLGQKVQGMQRELSNLDGPSALAALPVRMVVPFIRTPTNIVKYWGRRTPGLNMLSSEYREALQAGGVQADMARGKLALGSMLYATGLSLAAGGYITGGGEKDKTAEQLGGWQPYSLKIGDQYVAFNRADPVGMFLGISADVAAMIGHSPDSADDVATMALLAVSRNLTSKTWLSGVSDAIDVIASGDERKMQQYVQKQAGSLLPYSGLSRAIRREDDDLQREVWSVMDAWKNSIPGLSKDLPPHVNLLGEDVKVRAGLGIDLLSPFASSETNPSPAAQEVARLNLDLKHPPRSIPGGKGAPPVDLSPQQYYRWMKLMGNEAKAPNGQGFKEALEALVQSPEYQALPEDPTGSQYMDAKELAIKRLHEAYKSHATGLLRQEFPELDAKLRQNVLNAGAARSGQQLVPLQ